MQVVEIFPCGTQGPSYRSQHQQLQYQLSYFRTSEDLAPDELILIFQAAKKSTSKFRIIAVWAGNSPDRRFSCTQVRAQRISNAERNFQFFVCLFVCCFLPGVIVYFSSFPPGRWTQVNLNVTSQFFPAYLMNFLCNCAGMDMNSGESEMSSFWRNFYHWLSK